MTTSESPTHPDAPRAGGETADIDVAAMLKPCPFCGADEASGDVQTVRACGAYTINCWRCGARSPSEGVWNDAAAAWNRRAALPSLLERHRDGERAEPDAWLVVIHVRRGGSNTTARYFYSERETAEREADRKCNAIGDSFAQIFPLFAASPDADGSAPPSPERASK